MLARLSVASLAACCATAAPTLADELTSPLLKPALFVSLEMGVACSFGDEIDAIGTMNNVAAAFGATQGSGNLAFGDSDCGWQGRVGIGQSNTVGMGQWVDYWGVFVRHTQFGSDDFNGSYTAVTPGPGTYVSSLPGEYEEQRTVVDLELGHDVNIGGGQTARLFGGLRYSHFEGDVTSAGTSTVTVLGVSVTDPWTCSMSLRFDGAGPRIGLSTGIPLQGGVGLLLSTSASALYGERDTHCHVLIPGRADIPVSQSETGWVTNLEGEAGLTYALFGAGSELAVGVQVEAWFNQTEDGPWHADADRHNWGPFARINFNLSGP